MYINKDSYLFLHLFLLFVQYIDSIHECFLK